VNKETGNLLSFFLTEKYILNQSFEFLYVANLQIKFMNSN